MAETKESKSNSDFTPREMEIMAKAWCCMTEEPKVDYNKLAEACGMSNPRSASNAWSAIKKKILANAGITKEDMKAGGDGEGSAKTPKSSAKKRGKKAQAEENGDGEEATPTKKVKATPKKKAKAAKSEPEVEEDKEDVVDVAAEEKVADEKVKEEDAGDD